MKIKYILFFSLLVAAISSCTTAYRSGQTPDDVYYSPAPEKNSYVNSVNDRDRNSYSYRNDDYYRSDEEAEIRRGIRNPIYRNSIALDLGLGYSPYNYSPFGYSPYMYSPYGYGSYGYDPYMSHGMFSPYYNSYGYGGLYNPYSFYNPYGFYGSPYYGYGYGLGYYPSIISYRNVNTNTGTRRYNLNPYNSVNNSPAAIRNAVRSNIASGSAAPVRSFNTRPRSTGNGNVIRREMNSSQNRRSIRNSNRTYQSRNNNNYNNNNTRQERPTYQAPTRSFDSSPSPSSNSSSSGNSNSGSAPLRSFRR
jgi:hypothetical protein